MPNKTAFSPQIVDFSNLSFFQIAFQRFEKCCVQH